MGSRRGSRADVSFEGLVGATITIVQLTSSGVSAGTQTRSTPTAKPSITLSFDVDIVGLTARLYSGSSMLVRFA